MLPQPPQLTTEQLYALRDAKGVFWSHRFDFTGNEGTIASDEKMAEAKEFGTVVHADERAIWWEYRGTYYVDKMSGGSGD